MVDPIKQSNNSQGTPPVSKGQVASTGTPLDTKAILGDYTQKVNQGRSSEVHDGRYFETQGWLREENGTPPPPASLKGVLAEFGVESTSLEAVNPAYEVGANKEISPQLDVLGEYLYNEAKKDGKLDFDNPIFKQRLEKFYVEMQKQTRLEITQERKDGIVDYLKRVDNGQILDINGDKHVGIEEFIGVWKDKDAINNAIQSKQILDPKRGDNIDYVLQQSTQLQIQAQATQTVDSVPPSKPRNETDKRVQELFSNIIGLAKKIKSKEAQLGSLTSRNTSNMPEQELKNLEARIDAIKNEIEGMEAELKGFKEELFGLLDKEFTLDNPDKRENLLDAYIDRVIRDGDKDTDVTGDRVANFDDVYTVYKGQLPAENEKPNNIIDRLIENTKRSREGAIKGEIEWQKKNLMDRSE